MGPQEAQIPWVLRAEDLVPSPVSSVGVGVGVLHTPQPISYQTCPRLLYQSKNNSLFLCCGMGLGSRAGRPGPPHLTPRPGLLA